MKINKWTKMLFTLIVIDSIFTVYIGEEANLLILYMMKTFNLSLIILMIMRVFYCIPLLYFLNIKRNMSKLVFILYIGIYIVIGGSTLL